MASAYADGEKKHSKSSSAWTDSEKKCSGTLSAWTDGKTKYNYKKKKKVSRF